MISKNTNLKHLYSYFPDTTITISEAYFQSFFFFFEEISWFLRLFLYQINKEKTPPLLKDKKGKGKAAGEKVFRALALQGTVELVQNVSWPFSSEF